MQLDDDVGRVASSVPVVICIPLNPSHTPHVFVTHREPNTPSSTQPRAIRHTPYSCTHTTAMELCCTHSICDSYATFHLCDRCKGFCCVCVCVSSFTDCVSARAVEIFLRALLTRGADYASSRNAKTLTVGHL